MLLNNSLTIPYSGKFRSLTTTMRTSLHYIKHGTGSEVQLKTGLIVCNVSLLLKYQEQYGINQQHDKDRKAEGER